MDGCERIQKSIDFIESHLKDDIDIYSIVEQSHFSTTHFYRIFNALVGDSLKDYIRKRRLSNAVIELSTSKKRLIDIAFEYGFNSQEVFTRAFYRTFGITPGRYRTEKNKMVLYEKINVNQKILNNLSQGISLEPRIILDKEFKVVGLKKTVKPGDDLIRNLWVDFDLRKSEINNVNSPAPLMGLCEYMPNITDTSEFTYLACVEVSCFNHIPSKMISKIIPSSKYAVFTHKGSLEGLKSTYAYIYGTWLLHSKYELAELDTIELYYDNARLDLYIPIK